MKKALVTGASGFVGSHLVDLLLAKGIDVRCFDLENSRYEWLNDNRVTRISGDIRNNEKAREAVRDVDVIYHLAGLTKTYDTHAYFDVNVQGTVRLLQSVLDVNSNLKRFVFISSQSAAGPGRDDTPITENDPPSPITMYGRSKLEAEKKILEFRSKIPVTIIRPPVVYGPRDREGFHFFQIINRGVKPLMGWRDRYWSMVYVQDLVNGIVLASSHEKAIGQIYFIISDSKISWNELISEIIDTLGKKAVTLHIPFVFFKMLSEINEGLSFVTRKPVYLNREKYGELRERFWICSSEKAQHDFGYQPVFDLKKGIRKTVEWGKEIGWI